MPYPNKRIAPGLYEAKTPGGLPVEIERYPDGSWLVFEVINSPHSGIRREYWNDYASKKAALASIEGGNL